MINDVLSFVLDVIENLLMVLKDVFNDMINTLGNWIHVSKDVLTNWCHIINIVLNDWSHALSMALNNEFNNWHISNTQARVFAVCLAYELLVILYAKISFRHYRWKAIYIFMILNFMPVIGLVYLFFLNRTKLSKTSSIYTYNPDFIMDDLQNNTIKRIDVEREINTVPIQDALILNDSSTKRALLIDTFRDDVFTSIGFLKNALQDEDTETAHYAASAMTEMIRKLTIAIQELSVKYENNRDDLEVSIAYADVLTKYLNSGMLDERTQRQFQYSCSHVLNNINRIAPENSKYFVDKINSDLELGEFENGLKSCELFLSLHSDKEEPYFMYLKTYYLLHDNARFNEMLDTLKHSPVKLSYQGLMKIRFWLGRSTT